MFRQCGASLLIARCSLMRRRPSVRSWLGTWLPNRARSDGTEGSRIAPHCTAPVEDDAWHRFRDCPRWDALRVAVLGLPAGEAGRWARSLPPGVALAGLLPVSQGLREARGLLSRAPIPPAMVLPGAVRWTDGACVDPKDAWLARAAWACVADNAEPISGPVWGLQTAQRAEVQALFMACRSAEGLVEVVTDSQYARDTALSVRAGLLVEGAHGDLWMALLPALRSGRACAPQCGAGGCQGSGRA